MMEKRSWLIQGIITGAIGSFYEFIPRKTIRSISEFLLFDIDILGHRIRHNDLILAGCVLLIISFVSILAFGISDLKQGKNKLQRRNRMYWITFGFIAYFAVLWVVNKGLRLP